MMVSSGVFNIILTSFLFASSLFAPVFSVEIRGLAHVLVESSITMIQSLFFPDALYHAAMNSSEEGGQNNAYDFHNNMVAEQQEATKLPTASPLLHEDSVVFDLLTNNEYYYSRAGQNQKTDGRMKRQSGRNIYCGQNCGSRSRLPSNPREQVVGSGERW